MLIRSIRKMMKQIIWALVIAFALWGVGTMAFRDKGRKGPTFAGTIFNKKISFERYANSYNACKDLAIMQYGDNLPMVIKYLDLEGKAWERLILLTEAKRQNIKVNDQEIVESIKAYPFFQKDGKFDTPIYNYILKYRFNTDPSNFEAETRNSLAILKLRDIVLKDVRVSKEEVNEAYKKEFTEAEFSYFIVKQKDFIRGVKLTEDELRQFYQKNPADFKIPEQINIEYLEFSYPDFAGQVTINEESISAYYNNHLSEFESEKTDEQKTRYKPLEKVKSAIKEKLASIERRNYAREKAWEISDQLFENPDLALIAKNNSLTIKETGPFSKDGPIPTLGLSPQLRETVLSLEQPGQLSDPVPTPNGYYILKIKEKTDSYTPSFEKAKPKIEKVLTEMKSWQLSKQKAEQYGSEIEQIADKEKIDFKQAAERLSLKVQDSGQIKRTDYIPGIGNNPEFTETAFNLKKDEVSRPAKVENGYAIIWLIEYLPIDEQKLEKEFEDYRTKVLEQKKYLVYNEWLSGLKQQANLQSNIKNLK